nr:uncharacterized protein LOC127348136 [Lolium perenne]
MDYIELAVLSDHFWVLFSTSRRTPSPPCQRPRAFELAVLSDHFRVLFSTSRRTPSPPCQRPRAFELAVLSDHFRVLFSMSRRTPSPPCQRPRAIEVAVLSDHFRVLFSTSRRTPSPPCQRPRAFELAVLSDHFRVLFSTSRRTPSPPCQRPRAFELAVLSDHFRVLFSTGRRTPSPPCQRPRAFELAVLSDHFRVLFSTSRRTPSPPCQRPRAFELAVLSDHFRVLFSTSRRTPSPSPLRSAAPSRLVRLRLVRLRLRCLVWLRRLRRLVRLRLRRLVRLRLRRLVQAAPSSSGCAFATSSRLRLHRLLWQLHASHPRHAMGYIDIAIIIYIINIAFGTLPATRLLFESHVGSGANVREMIPGMAKSSSGRPRSISRIKKRCHDAKDTEETVRKRRKDSAGPALPQLGQLPAWPACSRLHLGRTRPPGARPAAGPKPARPGPSGSPRVVGCVRLGCPRLLLGPTEGRPPLGHVRLMLAKELAGFSCSLRPAAPAGGSSLQSIGRHMAGSNSPCNVPADQAPCMPGQLPFTW